MRWLMHSAGCACVGEALLRRSLPWQPRRVLTGGGGGSSGGKRGVLSEAYCTLRLVEGL